MRRLPSPVTVITAAADGEKRGITIGSFVSTSLDPALVSFNLSHDTPMLALVGKAARFVVHFLRDDQASLSDWFAIPDRSGQEQFEGVSFRAGPAGVPLLDDVMARLHCSLESVHEAGDHSILVGRVIQIEEVNGGRPLLYFDRSYHSLGRAVDASGQVSRSIEESRDA